MAIRDEVDTDPAAPKAGTVSEPCDEALVAQARADRRAFAPLYRRYVVPVYRYCHRRLGSREAAEDATAQVFARALAALPAYRAGSFRAWLFMIARHVVVDASRAARRAAPLDAAASVATDDAGPEADLLAAEDRRALRAALTMLPGEQRDVIELRLAGLTAAEIGAALGRSVPSVKSAQYRAFVRLRQLLRVEIYPEEIADGS